MSEASLWIQEAKESGRYPIRAGVSEAASWDYECGISFLMRQWRMQMASLLTWTPPTPTQTPRDSRKLLIFYQNGPQHWKIKSAVGKSQLLIIWRSRDRGIRDKAVFMLERLLQEGDTISILSTSIWTERIGSLPRKATQKLNAQRRIPHFLSPGGALQFYNSTTSRRYTQLCNIPPEHRAEQL